MSKTTFPDNFNYNQLLEDLQEIKQNTEERLAQAVNTVVAVGYWQMGRRLAQEALLSGKTRKAGAVLKELARDLDVEYSLLTRIIKFYKTFPKMDVLVNHPHLSWSHYKSLISLKTDEARTFYLKEAQANKWNKQQLIHRIKSGYREAIEEKPAQARPALLRGRERMYFYSGAVSKVVDGDTLVVDADLGFNVKMRMRLRLRGINTQEIDKASRSKKDLAFQAKEFVEGQLRKVTRIVFQSFKSDLYGRFVADVYYLPGEDDRELIFKNGRFLNQDLLDAGLAVIV